MKKEKTFIVEEGSIPVTAEAGILRAAKVAAFRKNCGLWPPNSTYRNFKVAM
ncbi:MAG: hypothetical protein WC637_17380 [Victivallales bacterium]